MSEDEVCSKCGKPEPRDWCWESAIDCPCGKPPRWGVETLVWTELVKLHKRVTALEKWAVAAAGTIGLSPPPAPPGPE